MGQERPLAAISDDELLRRLDDLLRQSRRVESDLIAHIAEVDERRLYAREASPSMFAYCTEVLRLSEAEAYVRIAVARASREHPILLDMLADGRLHLTGIARLAPHLTTENRTELLALATHKSRRQIEELIAEIAPRPDAPALVRRLPQRRQPLAPAFPVGAGESELAPPQLCPDRVGVGSLKHGLRGEFAFVASAQSNQQSSAGLQAPVAVPLPAVVWRRGPGHSGAADARSATVSSTAIATLMVSAATMLRRTSASCAGPTTPIWPKATTDESRRLGTAAQGTSCPRRCSSHRRSGS